MHGVVPVARPAVLGEHAGRVAQEEAVRENPEGHRPAFEDLCLDEVDVMQFRMRDKPVMAHARWLEGVLVQGPPVIGDALRRARGRPLALLEVLRALAVREIRAARRRRDALVSLDVLVHVVLPAAGTPVVLRGARRREAPGQRGFGPTEVGVRDAQATVQRAQSPEDPAAAAMALVVDRADDVPAMGPLVPAVERLRQLQVTDQLVKHRRP
mmetsp:Transcript_93335/g.285621  ORF Transcript_93335/g.285621 Transcript_93335/m.285621 type:complete len:212 (-) Transcript_93335:481-1116(-)